MTHRLSPKRIPIADTCIIWWWWGGGGWGGWWRQKIALIFLKIYYIVVLGIPQHILVHRNLWQKPYGFTAIWSQIFFRRKIYLMWSSTSAVHWKSLKSGLKTYHDVPNDILKELFFFKSRMGTPLDWKFWTRLNKIQFHISRAF